LLDQDVPVLIQSFLIWFIEVWFHLM
jgi:hypothetical protein